MAVDIIPLAIDDIQALQAQIVEVYRNAFTPPPYNKSGAEIEEFARSFPTQWQREAYRFVAALEGESKQLAGFAYGYASAAGRWWVDFVRTALSEPLASKWLENSFQLVEIAVRLSSQGQGIGGRLHDSLLAGLPHACALLGTMQADTTAYLLYRKRGWAVLAQDLEVPGVARSYQIMGLDLGLWQSPGNK
jgi:GNAT superfamily N-acetyltransferase